MEISIFVADDDIHDCLDTQRALKQDNLPFAVRVFRNGSELLEEVLTHGNRPDCLLLDMDMPIMDGYAVLKSLTFDFRNAKPFPIFVMSSSVYHQEILIERGCRPNAFIAKPVRSQELIRLLTENTAPHLPLYSQTKQLCRQVGENREETV